MNDKQLLAYNDRWDYFVSKTKRDGFLYVKDMLAKSMREAQKKQGVFRLALSGGSTPKEFYTLLTETVSEWDWKRVELYWSDERCVPPTEKESNYKMAMDAAFSHLPIPKSNIYRMEGEIDPKEAGMRYHTLLQKKIEEDGFDFTLLGMGEDCHTASLFPETHALHDETHLATANYIPHISSWRLTFTYKMINLSKKIVILCFGEKKKEAVRRAFLEPANVDKLPVQGVGSSLHKAIWVFDRLSVPEEILLS